MRGLALGWLVVAIACMQAAVAVGDAPPNDHTEAEHPSPSAPPPTKFPTVTRGDDGYVTRDGKPFVFCATTTPDSALLVTIDQEKKLGGRGKRSASEAVAGIRARSKSLLLCYDRAREHAPELSGEMRLVVTIGRTGKLLNARVAADTTDNSEFTACVANAAMETRYIGNDVGGSGRYKMRLIFERQPDRSLWRPGARNFN